VFSNETLFVEYFYCVISSYVTAQYRSYRTYVIIGPESLGPCEIEDRCSGGDSNKKAVKR
jgi:hypothetical protein